MALAVSERCQLKQRGEKMPRRREVPKREILPDPKFGNVELSKFMNVIMEGGKKAVAERIIYGAWT
jgi:small subunit ribosomal protein S7